MTYYDRQSTTHLDGTPIFQTADDRAHENEVARTIAECWGCEVRSFGALAPVDWYAQRFGRLVGLLELKSRSHAHDRYPTVFLNVRKWLTLAMGSLGLNVPALYVIRFTDGVWWVRVAEVDAAQHRIAGCFEMVKSVNDIEPIIEIPIERLTLLRPGAV